MNALQAKNFIKIVSKEWSKRQKKLIYSIIDIISSNPYREYMSASFFEFSLVSFELEVGLLHINFYKNNLPLNIINKIRAYRRSLISKIFHILSKESGNEYNLEIIDSVLDLAKGTRWPIQFGVELSKTCKRIKIYFSPELTENDLVLDKIKHIADRLRLNAKKITKKFLYENFDAIGFDFLNNGKNNLKIYTFYPSPFDISSIKKVFCRHQPEDDKYLKAYLARVKKMQLKHIGFLYRISDRSNVDSVKIWSRFEKFINPKLLLPGISSRSRNLEAQADILGRTIESVKGKVSYLTLEGQRLGFYFR